MKDMYILRCRHSIKHAEKGEEEYLYDDKALENTENHKTGKLYSAEIQRSGRDGCGAAVGDHSESGDSKNETRGDRRCDVLHPV